MRRILLCALLAALPAASGPPPEGSEIARALGWIQERGEAPLSVWRQDGGPGGPQLAVAVSARGVDEEAAGALYKIYRSAVGQEWEPLESIVLDAPTLLRLAPQQTILGLSGRSLASFLPAQSQEGLTILSITPRRFLQEPRIALLVQRADGSRFHSRFHAQSGAALPAGERVDFDRWGKDRPPAGFRFARTGEGRPGSWVVRERDGNRVLVQEDDDPTDFRYPVAVLEDLPLRNGSVSARVKPCTGSVDQAAGIVFRYRDEDNYYVTRANALEENVRLYYVKAGQRVGIASWDGTVGANQWHTYKVVVEGARIQVQWDGVTVIEVEDRTFAEDGAVGLWTKADSVTEFDDFVVEPSQ